MMPEINRHENNQRDKRSLFELVIEIIGWLQIVASPLAVGLLIGSMIYFRNPTNINLIIAIVVTVAGLIIGIIWATRIFKRKGTINFLSSAMATPELDEIKEKD